MSNVALVRGNTIKFTSNFYNSVGALTDPSSANLYIAYLVAGAYVIASPIAMAMTGVTGIWYATWESSVADVGRVFFCAVSGGSTPFSREDGSFLLSANPANPEP